MICEKKWIAQCNFIKPKICGAILKEVFQEEGFHLMRVHIPSVRIAA